MASKGCGCKIPDLRRMTADGQEEFSFDNGATWQSDPDDSRFSGIRLPLPPGFVVANQGCAGAESATNALKLVIDEIIANTGSWDTLISLVAGIVAAVSGLLSPVAGAIAGIIGAIAVLLFVIGRDDIITAMTTEVYETLKCCFACNISADASFTTDQWNAVKQCIVDELDGTPQNVCWYFVQLLGPVYLSNAARQFPTTGADCSECGCSCDDIQLGGVGANLVEAPDLGAGWWRVDTEFGNPPVPSGNGDFYAQIEVPACCCLTAYDYPITLVNAPPGNRVAHGCDGTNHTGNYGLNAGLVDEILFRAFDVGTISFKIEEACL